MVLPGAFISHGATEPLSPGGSVRTPVSSRGVARFVMPLEPHWRRLGSHRCPGVDNDVCQHQMSGFVTVFGGRLVCPAPRQGQQLPYALLIMGPAQFNSLPEAAIRAELSRCAAGQQLGEQQPARVLGSGAGRLPPAAHPRDAQPRRRGRRQARTPDGNTLSAPGPDVSGPR